MLLFLVICMASQSHFKTKANKNIPNGCQRRVKNTSKMGGCFSSAPMPIQCPFPPSHFQLTSSIGHKPIKGSLACEPTKFTKRNSYILICKPQHETETPMIPDAQHTWIWTVHLKVPGGNHRALVLQKYMTKSIQNSFLTIEFVSW